MLFADLFKGRKRVDTRVVDENVEASVRFDGRIVMAATTASAPAWLEA
jgi:hypothetical protein